MSTSDGVVETQLSKLRDTSDTLVERTYSIRAGSRKKNKIASSQESALVF